LSNLFIDNSIYRLNTTKTKVKECRFLIKRAFDNVKGNLLLAGQDYDFT